MVNEVSPGSVMRELMAIATIFVVLAIAGGEPGAQAGSPACALESIVNPAVSC
jgi:hypothetical protein